MAMGETRHRTLGTDIEPTRRRRSFFVDLPNFIQATRDSGYKSTAAALAEFVDNSIRGRCGLHRDRCDKGC